MIHLIVATSKNGSIGQDNKLLWNNQKDDMNHFKELTQGSTVLMGRKTYESIGRPLPKRTNIVVSRNPELVIPGCLVVKSIEDGIKKSDNNKKLFIIGGEQIYKQTLKYVTTIELTIIETELTGDTHFYSVDRLQEMGFKITQELNYPADEKNDFPYTFITLKR